MNKKRIIWIIVGIVIVVLLALPKLKPSQQNPSDGKASSKNNPVQVTIFKAVLSQTSENIKVSGNILAMEEVELKSETQGRIVKINFEEGSEVTRGQLLVKINDADLRAQLKKAESTQLLKTETETRSKRLLDKGAISQEEYDLALTERNSINADIELLREQIRKTEITAPFNGVIGLRYISLGSYVNNASQIASLHDIKSVKVEFSVPEKYAARVGKGNRILFHIEGSDRTYEAVIYAVEPKVEAATRNVVMRAVTENKDKTLLPGAFANVTVNLGNEHPVLLIPTQAVVPILKGKKVFIMAGDSAVERMITTGTRGDSLIEVKDGLQPDEQVIVNGVMYLRQGSKVKL